MGWVTMSERELRRVEVLAQLDDGRIDASSAAHVLPQPMSRATPNAIFTTRPDAELKLGRERIARVEERRAVHDLLDAGLKMVAPEEVQDWMLADDDRPFPAAR
jgi:hypothetical protein